jgi:chromosome segregation ATPase
MSLAKFDSLVQELGQLKENYEQKKKTIRETNQEVIILKDEIRVLEDKLDACSKRIIEFEHSFQSKAEHGVNV